MSATRLRRSRAATLTGALIIGAVVMTHASPADAKPRAISGRYVVQSVSGPECTSPAGVCATGTLSGGLQGSFTSSFNGVIPTSDSPTTSVILYTADMSVQTRDGSFQCKDAGAVQTSTGSAHSNICVITNGTGDYAGASGTLQMLGTFSTSSAGGGIYEARLNLPS